MKALSADSILARLLGKLTAAVIRYPKWFIYPQAALFVVCVLYTIGYLKADMNRDHLVGPNHKNQENYLRLQKEFPLQGNDLVVVVESGNTELNRQLVERIAAKMRAETNLFADVFYQQDPSVMGAKALLFASTNDLVALKGELGDALPFLRQFTPTTNLISFFEQVNTEFRTTPRETNAQTESLVRAIPALTTIVKQAADSLELGGTPPGPNLASLFNSGSETNIYITYDHGRYFLVRARASNESLNIPAIKRLRELIGQTQDEVPGVNVGLIGEPVLDYDEMVQSQKDVTLASIVSLLICGLIFIYGYNETGRPIKANVCLIIGLGYTLAFATLTIGHLNILTITFVPMLIGLAIDFGVHLITRYEEELRHGKTREVAMNKAMVFTGQGILTGGLTTAGAFLAMAFTHFRGIQEMGIICGGGLLLCLMPMMTMLPALLLKGRQNVLDHNQLATREDEARARIEDVWLRRPVIVVAATVVLCALAVLMGCRVYFDYNLQKLQSIGLPSVIFEEKLFAAADQSLLYGAVVADSVTNAIDLAEKIGRLSTVANVEPPISLLENFVKPSSPEKLKLIGQIKQELAPLQFGVPDRTPVNINKLSATLYSLYGYLGAALDEIGNSDPELAKQFVSLQNAIEELRKAMLQGSTQELKRHAENLAQFQQALFNDMRSTFEVLQHQDDRAPLHVTDLPPALRNQFVGVTGKLLLQVYPNIDVWQRDNQEKFIGQLRTVDPNVTGTPVQLYEFEELLKNSYLQAAWYSLAAIALLVFFHFRSIGSVILALLPVAIGTLWLLGVMGWVGLPFNPANIMTLPLVIGIGVTNGIHVLNRFAEERTPSILARSTGKAVLVSGLTAIAGFGSLILAKDRGIHSLGCIMSIGIATCMIAGLTFLPALLNLLGRWRPLIKTNQPSAGNPSPTLGQEEPRSKNLK
ncbi:MAG TPA: MMPL family transporter [Candidatus Saccharimonadales bacterium]|nr:MMPL family transporter [Candidatus Saccharimonadales bacterium]